MFFNDSCTAQLPNIRKSLAGEAGSCQGTCLGWQAENCHSHDQAEMKQLQLLIQNYTFSVSQNDLQPTSIFKKMVYITFP